MKILTVTDLVKKFGNFTAVKGVNFSIEKGEIFGFLGPNGAGKTTTINMLTGLAAPSSGSIVLSGMDGVKDIKKVQQIIGIVPDDSNLYDEMSGFENLIFCASLYGIEKRAIENRAKDLLELFGLSSAGKKPFRAYSKGMKRKLTIAAGIIHKPEILFLDEPTTGIDVESARKIRELIGEMNREGTTVFLTTHYIEEAERLCHRICFIVDGRIAGSGSIDELMADVRRDHAVQFTFEGDAADVKNSLEELFPDDSFHIVGDKSVRVVSHRKINILPFVRYFEENNVNLFEAKILRPSLEEVFVKFTGIEAGKMKKEKEGGKK